MKICRFCVAIACGLLSAPLLSAYQEVFTFTTPAGSPYLAGNPLGTADGTNNSAQFYGPAGVAMGAGTNLYVVDGNVIRRIAPVGSNWVVNTLAGDASQHGGNDGTNSAARFDSPQGVAVDGAGNLYVADTANNAIRKVTPVGTNWVVTTLAGAGRFNEGSNDGTNTTARFNHPYGIAVDSATNLYVADTINHTIRKVAPVGTNWVVTTVAGMATNAGSANGTNSSARFFSPAALTVGSGTNLYVADTSNHAIRKVTPAGTNWVVSTVAGLAGTPGSANGTNTDARFASPAGIAVDSAGQLFVSDSGNSTIRKVRSVGTNWVVSTLAGLAGALGNVDGTGSTARFDYPYGIVTDTGGSLYVMDNASFTLRAGKLAILLQAVSSGNQIVLSWPLAGSNFVLETKGSLSSASWSRLTNAGVASGDSYSFTTNIVPPAAFFRLHKP
jgi:hypothetical protein